MNNLLPPTAVTGETAAFLAILALLLLWGIGAVIAQDLKRQRGLTYMGGAR